MPQVSLRILCLLFTLYGAKKKEERCSQNLHTPRRLTLGLASLLPEFAGKIWNVYLVESLSLTLWACATILPYPVETGPLAAGSKRPFRQSSVHQYRHHRI